MLHHDYVLPSGHNLASQVVLVIKNPPANAGGVRDMGLVPGLGWSSGRGHSNPLQYPCLENPTDRGACEATVHRVAKSWAQPKRLSMARQEKLQQHGSSSSVFLFFHVSTFWNLPAFFGFSGFGFVFPFECFSSWSLQLLFLEIGLLGTYCITLKVELQKIFNSSYQ